MVAGSLSRGPGAARVDPAGGDHRDGIAVAPLPSAGARPDEVEADFSRALASPGPPSTRHLEAARPGPAPRRELETAAARLAEAGPGGLPTNLSRDAADVVRRRGISKSRRGAGSHVLHSTMPDGA
jgi:hypothetical protein